MPGKTKTVAYGDRAAGPPKDDETLNSTKMSVAAPIDYTPMKTVATEELKQSRDYARSATKHSLQEAVAGCVESLQRYGFCVLDDVIPEGEVDEVCEEVRQAPSKSQANRELLEQGDPQGIQRDGRLKYPSSPVCDLAWMPKYSEHLAHPVVVAVAKSMLDDHIRIAQFNYRAIGQSSEGSRLDPRRRLLREWHTDWPHDLIGYGAGEKHFEEGKQGWGQRNAGCIRQPFPDVCMCLTMM